MIQVTRRATSTPLETIQQQLTIEQNLTDAIGGNLNPRKVIELYQSRRVQSGWTWEK
jgi:hypothetical protein